MTATSSLSIETILQSSPCKVLSLCIIYTLSVLMVSFFLVAIKVFLSRALIATAMEKTSEASFVVLFVNMTLEVRTSALVFAFGFQAKSDATLTLDYSIFTCIYPVNGSYRPTAGTRHGSTWTIAFFLA